jgi:hypothetical protein
MGIHFTPVTAIACDFVWQGTAICCGHLSQVDTHLKLLMDAWSVAAPKDLSTPKKP